MTRNEHRPVRTCIGCGRRDLREDMVRVVRDGQGCLSIDTERRCAGRGAYLHRVEECWQGFARRKGTVRSLRASVDRQVRFLLVEQLRQAVGA